MTGYFALRVPALTGYQVPVKRYACVAYCGLILVRYRLKHGCRAGIFLFMLQGVCVTQEVWVVLHILGRLWVLNRNAGSARPAVSSGSHTQWEAILSFEIRGDVVACPPVYPADVVFLCFRRDFTFPPPPCYIWFRILLEL